MREQKINSVSEFIECISKLVKEKNSDNESIVVYRGEPKKYEIPGKPGIFRDVYLQDEKFFEKNLLTEMSANRVTKGSTYLEKAVDAQHDEFPSRLLDVTYNALVALYFAVTPFYKKNEENAYDDKYDGQVIVYFIPQMYCAGTQNIENIFEEVIGGEGTYLLHPLAQENHKLVDHIKMNTRICVQQGAFILFQGREYSPISEKDYEVIVVDKKSRALIRKELSILFGINTGFIYPEPFNLNNIIANKAKRVTNEVVSAETELDLFFQRVEGEVNYYFDEAIETSSCKTVTLEKRKEDLLKEIMKLEEILYRYKEELLDYLEKFIEKKEQEIFIIRFNSVIREYFESFSIFEKKYEITLSKEELVISEDV